MGECRFVVTNEKLTVQSCLGIFIAHQARDPIDQSKVAAAQQRLYVVDLQIK